MVKDFCAQIHFSHTYYPYTVEIVVSFCLGSIIAICCNVRTILKVEPAFNRRIAVFLLIKENKGQFNNPIGYTCLIAVNVTIHITNTCKRCRGLGGRTKGQKWLSAMDLWPLFPVYRRNIALTKYRH